MNNIKLTLNILTSLTIVFAISQVFAQTNNPQDEMTIDQQRQNNPHLNVRLVVRDIDEATWRIESLQHEINRIKEQMPSSTLNSRFSPVRILAPLTPVVNFSATSSEIAEVIQLQQSIYERYDRLNTSRKEAKEELADWIDTWDQAMEELEALAESYDLSHTCSDSDVMPAYNDSDNIKHIGCLISFYLDNYNNDDPGNPHRSISDLQLQQVVME